MPGLGLGSVLGVLPRMLSEGYTQAGAARFLRSQGFSFSNAPFRYVWGLARTGLELPETLGDLPARRGGAHVSYHKSGYAQPQRYWYQFEAQVPDLESGEPKWRRASFFSDRLLTADDAEERMREELRLRQSKEYRESGRGTDDYLIGTVRLVELLDNFGVTPAKELE